MPHFFTEYPVAGSLGTDAFAYQWSDGISPDAAALAWVFPGSGFGLRAINAWVEQRVNAILVLPEFANAAVWRSLLHHVLPVKRRIDMAYRPGLYWTGLRAPEWLQVRKCALTFYLVEFH